MTQISNSSDPEAFGPHRAGKRQASRHLGSADTSADVSRLAEETETLKQITAAQMLEIEHLGQRNAEFLAIGSHELKAPLTAILGYAQYGVRILKSEEPDLDKVRRALEVIQRQSNWMMRVVEDLLDASRIQMEPFEVQWASSDMDVMLTSVLSRLSADERARVDVSMPVNRVAGRWDQERIEHVLSNLIENALKYSDNASRVSVAVSQHASFVEVAVRDHGRGIPTHELERVFERFHRTPEARASGVTGTGLGLYICRGIVSSHHGRLWAESSGENQGATFRFTVPNQPSTE